MHICDQIFQKGSYIHTQFQDTLSSTSASYISMHQQHMCLILLKVEQCAFTQASLSSCLTSKSALVSFKWPHLPLASKQPTVNHHMTG